MMQCFQINAFMIKFICQEVCLVKIAMIVLAAGFSSRMGVSKPLLPVGPDSALVRTVGLGKLERIHMISVVTGSNHEEVEAELLKAHAKNIRHIYNSHFADGMFSSVKAGIHSLPADTDGFFLLPVDHCAVRPDTIEKLMTAFILSDGHSVIYPSYKGERGHPPLIPYRVALDIKNYSGEDGMRGYLAGFPSGSVEVDDPAVLIDMDTPDDYAALLNYLGLPAYPSEETALHLLEKYGAPEPVIAHGKLVRGVALRLAEQLEVKGVSVNRGLLAAACLLHDIARDQPAHEQAGARLVLSEGYPQVARLIETHMVLPENQDIAPDEANLLYLADKLARDGKIVLPGKTLEDLKEKYAGNPEALLNAEKRLRRAEAVMHMLRDRYGINPADIASDAT